MECKRGEQLKKTKNKGEELRMWMDKEGNDCRGRNSRTPRDWESLRRDGPLSMYNLSYRRALSCLTALTQLLTDLGSRAPFQFR
jgi:hypothetical protein